MGPFEAQLREFIRRLDFMEDEVRGHGRKLTAIRQNLRDADDTGIKAKLARLSGEVDGCASAGFPGATVAIYHHATGVKLGELTCDAGGLYEGRVGLDSDPQDVDIVATPTGTYASRFDGPVVTPATLSVGANAVPPIVIPPTADWCCGEVDYFPGECGPPDCAPDATHVCPCGFTKPTTASFGDDVGTHTLTWNSGTSQYTALVDVPNLDLWDGSCVHVGMGTMTIGYTLQCNTATSTWKLSVNVGIILCSSVLRYSDVNKTVVVSDEIPFDPDETTLVFTLPTSWPDPPGGFGSLPVPGGGGTITVVF